MHRSYWDVEVHAKDYQERRRQEAVRQRRIDEAIGAPVNPFNLGIARFVRTAKARFSSVRAMRAAERAGDEAPASAPPEMKLASEGQMPRPSAARLSQPYAGMVVIARGPAVRVTEQPRVSSDC